MCACIYVCACMYVFACMYVCVCVGLCASELKESEVWTKEEREASRLLTILLFYKLWEEVLRVMERRCSAEGILRLQKSCCFIVTDYSCQATHKHTHTLSLTHTHTQ